MREVIVRNEIDDVRNQELAKLEAIFDSIESHNSNLFREIMKEVEGAQE